MKLDTPFCYMPPSQTWIMMSYTTLGGVLIGVLAIILLIISISHCHHRRQSPVDPSYHNDDNAAASIERGLDEATIRSCPKMLYSEVKQHVFGGNNVSCGTSGTSCCCICLAEFEDKDVLRSVPNCGHFFHQVCVDKWLMLHPTCPVCRNSLVVDPVADQV